ncbi:hypothetical protein PACTADRAFT_34339 [Pachysolen tannophilus NRRL Y-2460]|uniref:XLF-like N-terminal domain-containing protein n=1 Tax=Pachysolen tannophilus NRRL Y-2460 TaxID=669874 RepID=A0A1E4TS67_PACTA|nr:hypothetical protein PACTADRAFT_34339 [Pachysolen tannophilus NRRL Y-2460]
MVQRIGGFQVPKCWSLLEHGGNKNYIYGFIKGESSEENIYTFVITDLINVWIEEICKQQELIDKTKQNGIHVVDRSTALDTLDLLDASINSTGNSDENSSTNSQVLVDVHIHEKCQNDEEEDIPMLSEDEDFVPYELVFSLVRKTITTKNPKPVAYFNWEFNLKLLDNNKLRAEFLERIMFEMFNTMGHFKKVQNKLVEELKNKDRIISLLLESLIDINGFGLSSSSTDEARSDESKDNLETRVEKNNYISKIIPKNSVLRNHLNGFNYKEFEKNYIIKEKHRNNYIWSVIGDTLNQEPLWKLSDHFTLSKSQAPVQEMRNKRVRSSTNEFIEDVDFEKSSSTEKTKNGETKKSQDSGATRARPISSPRKKKAFGIVSSQNIINTSNSTSPRPATYPKHENPEKEKAGNDSPLSSNISEKTPDTSVITEERAKRKLKANPNSFIKAPRNK